QRPRGEAEMDRGPPARDPGRRGLRPIPPPPPDRGPGVSAAPVAERDSGRPPAPRGRLPTGGRRRGADRRAGGAARICDLPLRRARRKRVLATAAADRARRGAPRARGRERWLWAFRSGGGGPRG